MIVSETEWGPTYKTVEKILHQKFAIPCILWCHFTGIGMGYKCTEIAMTTTAILCVCVCVCD